MAIIPSTRYAGQVVTPGGSYPLGKARNEVVEGDGSGTPLEEAWVNDIWGFLQALLAVASITASGSPDQVGASQYLMAVQAIVNAFSNSSHTWFADQIFGYDVRLNSSITLGTGVEMAYAAARTRKVQVPLNPRSASSWTASTTTPAWVTAAGNPLVIMIGRDVLPGGAVIKNVRALVTTSVDVTLSARQHTYDTSVTTSPVAGTAYTDTFVPVGTQSHILAANFPAFTYHFNEALAGVPTQLQIVVTPATGASCTLWWVEIEYDDQIVWNI